TTFGARGRGGMKANLCARQTQVYVYLPGYFTRFAEVVFCSLRIFLKQGFTLNKLLHRNVLQRQTGFREVMAEVLNENTFERPPVSEVHYIGKFMQILSHYDHNQIELRIFTIEELAGCQ